MNSGAEPIELVIFVGLQAAGKSTFFAAQLAATHVHVSKDLMKNTRDRDARQEREIAAALTAGKSVVVDNTNSTPAVRAPLIALGRQHGARLVACYFQTTVKDALARNRGREGKARVPDVAIFTTAKKLVPPTIEEGFDEVRMIPPLAPVPA
jgi:predicted kinase